MQKLFRYIEQFVELDNEAKVLLENFVEIKTYRKNDFLLEQGKKCNKIWFLAEGMVRKFRIIDGCEHTCWIHTENDIFTSLQSYMQQTLSEEYIQACETIEVISISKEKSLRFSENEKLNRFGKRIMEEAFANIDKHSVEFANRNAREKYKYLGQIAPEMIKRAKLGYIANILGISQETLSRIRKG